MNELSRSGEKWNFDLYGSDFANAKYLSVQFGPCMRDSCMPEFTSRNTPDAHLKDIIKSVSSPELYFMINEARLDLTVNGEESVKEQSKIIKYQFNPDHPTWSKVQIGADQLRDSNTITEAVYDFYSLSPSEYL